MIYERPAFSRACRTLGEQRCAEVRAVAVQIPLVFGRPHLHSGLGVRPFGEFFEARVGRGLRIIFLPHKETCSSNSSERTTKSAGGFAGIKTPRR